MRDAGFAQPRQEGVERFPVAVELQRTFAGQSAQEDLQPAIAADVVEGRPLLQGRLGYRAHQRAESMNDQLGRPGGARGRQDPFRLISRCARRFQRPHGKLAARSEFDFDRRLLAVVRYGVGLGVAHDARQHVRLPAGRAEHDAPRNSVEVDQRGGGERHIAHEQHDRAASQPLETVAEARMRGEILEPEPMVARCDDAAATRATLEETRKMQKFRQALFRRTL